jgi:hypothetical protein
MVLGNNDQLTEDSIIGTNITIDSSGTPGPQGVPGPEGPYIV